MRLKSPFFFSSFLNFFLHSRQITCHFASSWWFVGSNLTLCSPPLLRCTVGENVHISTSTEYSTRSPSRSVHVYLLEFLLGPLPNSFTDFSYRNSCLDFFTNSCRIPQDCFWDFSRKFPSGVCPWILLVISQEISADILYELLSILYWFFQRLLRGIF